MYRIGWFILAFAPSLAAQVVLSEIMFNPWGEERDNEFVEIVNLDSLPISIDGWLLSDGEQSTPIRGYNHDGYLQPGKYGLIFSPRYFANSTLYDSLMPADVALFVVESAQLGRNGLANTRSETVSLFSAQGEWVAGYCYTVPNPNGHSEEKRSLFFPDSATNWDNSRVLHGTPGSINSIAPPLFELKIDSVKLFPCHLTRRDSCHLSITCQNRGSSPIKSLRLNSAIKRLTNGEIVSQKTFVLQNLELNFLQHYTHQLTFAPLLFGLYELHLSIDCGQSAADTTIDLTVDAAEGDICINEVWFDDSPWIELYNTTDQPIDLLDWALIQGNEIGGHLLPDYRLEPQHYAVCATDSPAVLSLWTLNAPRIQPNPALHSLNATNPLVLRSVWGGSIDSCVFPLHSPLVSLERVDPLKGGNIIENWIECPHPAGGTCGERNACTAPFADLAVKALQTNITPQRPRRGESLVLSYTIESIGNLPSEPFGVRLGHLSFDRSDTTWVAENRHPALHSGAFLTDQLDIMQPEPGASEWVVGIWANDAYRNNNRLLLPIRVGWAERDVVINEVQYHTADRLDEWIELYNTLDQTVDLSDWSLGDRVRTVLLDTYTLKPRSFVVLTHRLLSNIPSDGQLIVALPELNNSGDSIELLDAEKNMIDHMNYDGGYGCESEQSLERVRYSAPSELISNWICSTDNRGSTPGRYNSNSPKNRDLAIQPELCTWECSEPLSGNAGVWNTGIENRGLERIDRFRLLHELYSPSQGGIVYSETMDIEQSINPGETALFPWVWNPLQGGTHVLRLGINCPGDENPDNDSCEYKIFISHASSPLIINEILNNPMNHQTEAFEIMNRSNETVCIENWLFTDADTTRLYALGDSLLCIPAQGFLVISRDSMSPAGENSVFVTGKTFPVLSQQDELYMIDANGLIADQTKFDHVLKGRSLERISPQLAADLSENWAASVDPEGHTLGRSNSIYMPMETTSVELSVRPPIFSPDGDGYDDVAAITFALPETVARVDLRIFDARGRLIRYLLNNAESAASSTILWDGKDGNGQICRVGVYIIHLRALDRRQSVIRQTVETVVVAGKL